MQKKVEKRKKNKKRQKYKQKKTKISNITTIKKTKNQNFLTSPQLCVNSKLEFSIDDPM